MLGFLLLFLTFYPESIPNTKGAVLKLILLCLAAFALIAGLAPSVVRSVTMFSFVSDINCDKRQHLSYFIVSILLIFTFQPSFLF
jgi:competence protein ComEC